MQICRRLISADAIMQPLIARLDGAEPTPDEKSIENILHLFYPNLEESAAGPISTSLIALDTAMANDTEKVYDRWKVIILTVCESPGWELL